MENQHEQREQIAQIAQLRSCFGWILLDLVVDV
jgi:hypothetical protein